MNWKFYLAMAIPFLNFASTQLKNKDTNDTGPDDVAANFLHYAASALAAIAAEQPIPPIPSALAAKIVAPGTNISA